MSNLWKGTSGTAPARGKAPAVYADRTWIAKQTDMSVQPAKNKIRPRAS